MTTPTAGFARTLLKTPAGWIASGLGALRNYVDTFWTDVLSAFQAAALVEHARGRKSN